MAEVQDDILWICEAPPSLIWTTLVLESLAKTGFVRDAVATLDNTLRRMEAHQSKKRAMLRPLHVAHAATPGSLHAVDSRQQNWALPAMRFRQYRAGFSGVREWLRLEYPRSL